MTGLNASAGLGDLWVVRDGVGSVERGYLSESAANTAYFGELWRWRFADCYDLLREFTQWFGVVPRHRYDISDSRHKVQLIGRGTGFSTPLVLSTPTESLLTVQSDVLCKALTASRTQDTVGFAYGKYYNNKGTVGVGDLPGRLTSDLDVGLDFIARFTGSGGTRIAGTLGEFLSVDPTQFGQINDAEIATHLTYYNWEAGSFSGSYQRSAEAHVRYWYSGFGTARRGYTRTYPNMRASDGTTNSHKNLHVLRKTTIGEKTFMAIEVSKNIPSGTAQVKWIEV